MIKTMLGPLAVVGMLAVSACEETHKESPAKAQRTTEAQPLVELKVTIGPVAQLLSDTSVRVSWSTNVSAETLLRYGTQPNQLDGVAREPWGGVTHRVLLQNLTPKTTYYYRVGVPGAESKEAMSSIATFHTDRSKELKENGAGETPR